MHPCTCTCPLTSDVRCDDARQQPQHGLREFLMALDVLIARLQSDIDLLGGHEYIASCQLRRRECQATCYPAGMHMHTHHSYGSMAQT